jgi:hypothetical protein
MPRRAHVLNVRRRNRNATRLLFRRLVDLIERRHITTMYIRHHPRQRSRQRRLSMVHMTNRPYIYVRLLALKF